MNTQSDPTSSQTRDGLPTVCPVCASQLIDVEPDSNPAVLSQTGRRCEVCGWSVIGTHVPAMLADTATYSLVLNRTETPQPAQLRLVHQRLGIGLAEAKTLITEKDVVLFEGTAAEIHKHREAIVDAGFGFHIKPDFPY